tara:strand:- start:143 stop:637 length:495 start_codon:yes stop_codon:yes gene_type:complete
MKIARLTGDKVGEIATCQSLFPNTSFPKSGPNAEWLSANSCAEVVTFLSFDSATQTCDSVEPYLSGGKVYTRSVTDMTSDETAAVITAATAAKAKHQRSERNRRLKECDWVVIKALESGTLVASEWVTYRTALREITTHPNWPHLSVSNGVNPSSSDWPTEPKK